jgi:hypothetical protein
MLIFIDTEFNGFGGELISLALVTNTGKDFYEALTPTKPIVHWVRENVMPYLEQEPITIEKFQVKLYQYLMDVSEYCREPLTIIADWPDDIKYFCESLITGPGTSIPTPVKMNFVLDRSLSSELSQVPHNAYHDAVAIMKDYYGKNNEVV